MLRVNSRDRVLVNLGPWTTARTSNTPSPERSAITRTICAAFAAVLVERVTASRDGVDLPGEMLRVVLHLVEA